MCSLIAFVFIYYIVFFVMGVMLLCHVELNLTFDNQAVTV